MANLTKTINYASSKLLKIYYIGTSMAIIMTVTFYGAYYVYLQNTTFAEVNYAVALRDCQTKQRQVPTNDTIRIDNFKSYPCDEVLYMKKCGMCAYVTGSGHLHGSKKGSEIDSYDCVFRSNSAPISGYEEDVGKRTDFRTVDHLAIRYMVNKLENDGVGAFDSNTFNHTIFLGFKVTWHGEVSEMVNILSGHPEMSFYILSESKLEALRKLYHKEIGTTNFFLWMTNGFVSLLLMRDFCEEIHVYGIADENRCDEVKVGAYDDVPYHYYGFFDTVETECWRFWRHGNGFWGHQFLKEKILFRKWFQEWGNLYFHQPEWK